MMDRDNKAVRCVSGVTGTAYGVHRLCAPSGGRLGRQICAHNLNPFARNLRTNAVGQAPSRSEIPADLSKKCHGRPAAPSTAGPPAPGRRVVKRTRRGGQRGSGILPARIEPRDLPA